MKASIILIATILLYSMVAKGQISQFGKIDTTQFINQFDDSLSYNIAQQLHLEYANIYRSDTGFVGLTVILFEILDDYSLRNIIFSKSTPYVFQQGIRKAIIETLEQFKAIKKPVVNLSIVMPIHFNINRLNRFKESSTFDVLDGLTSGKSFINCIILPTNSIQYSQ